MTARGTHPRKAIPRDLAPAGAVSGPSGTPSDAQLARRQNRFAFFSLAFAAVFAIAAARMLVIGLTGDADSAAPVARASADAPTLRADLTDRNGMMLATDLRRASVFAEGQRIWDPAQTAQDLASVLPGLDAAALQADLEKRRAFTWVRRSITPRERDAVHALGLPGIGFRQEARRVYPNGRIASHVLGFTDVDNRGLAGLELGLDAQLRAAASAGETVATSIDLAVQHVLEDELAATVATFSAIGAAGLILDVGTGEVIAMASLPDFDPNLPTQSPAENRFNRITLGVYEMGSTFKAFTTAMALESGKVTLASGYDASQPIRYGRFTIRDFKPQNRWLTIAEIFEHSSNIGSAKMALDVGPAQHRAFIESLGLTRPLAFEIPEMGAPMTPRQWGEIQSITIAFGHGMAVTPLQMAAAGAAMVNGGVYRAPTLLKRTPGASDSGRRVISESTSAAMRQLFRQVVENGTGRKADVEGYPVGGKTGTAEKARAGGYARKALLSSFMGAFPAMNPRYLVLVLIDEPKGTAETAGYATGGWTAAPAAGNVIRRIAPILHVQPELPARAPELTAAALSPQADHDHAPRIADR